MDILIRTEGVELTDKLHEAVTRKIGRVRQYAPRALRARVRRVSVLVFPGISLPRQCRKDWHSFRKVSSARLVPR